MRRAGAAAAAGALLTLVGLAFDAATLLVAGPGLAATAAVAAAWAWLIAGGARLRRELSRPRVSEGEPLALTYEITSGRLGLSGATLIDALLDGPAEVQAPIGPRRRVRVLGRVIFERRGLHAIEAPRLVVRDPLHLATMSRPGEAAELQVLVLPAVAPMRGPALTGPLGAAAGGSSSVPQGAVEVDGLIPYQPGTPASRIHWPALARGAGLLERRLRADSDAFPLVALDAREPACPEDLDAAVRAAASLALALARRGGCRLLLAGDRRATVIGRDLSAWPAAHARLALVAADVRPPALGPGSRDAALLYVSARGTERLPPALAGAAAARRLLVIPCQRSAPAHLPPSFELCGCVGYEVREATVMAATRPAA